MATPAAPTLEDLPPERGTILELQSTGSEAFDGMIVEFVKVDKETGQYFVEPLFDKNVSDGMRVKQKCVRRPDIKPMELRLCLSGISQQIHDRKTTAQKEVEDDMKSLERLLQKDPCCVPAHFVLGNLAARLLSKSSLFNDEQFRHIRRGLVNLYAYQDIVTDSLVQYQKTIYAHFLLHSDRLNSAREVSQQLRSEKEGQTIMQQLSTDYSLVRSLMAKCEKHSTQQHAKQIDNLLQAAEVTLEILRASVERHEEVVSCGLDDLFDSIVNCTVGSLAIVVLEVVTARDAFGEEVVHVDEFLKLFESTVGYINEGLAIWSFPESRKEELREVTTKATMDFIEMLEKGP